MSEQDKHETPIMFRVDRAGEFKGTVTAVFPAELADHSGLYNTCYAHIGQHGQCDWQWVLSRTRPATPDEYASLKRELESLGYRVKVVRKQTRQHREHARAELNRINQNMRESA